LNRPEAIASLFSRPMRLVSRVTSPVVSLLSGSTSLLLKILRFREVSDAAITEEEIKAHIMHSTEIGVFEETEQELIESVIRLDDKKVPALMTSRLKIAWLDLLDDVETNRKKIIDFPYSRLPVCRGELDEIVGFVKSRDLLAHVLKGEPLNLQSVLKQPLFVPETQTALELLELFRGSHTHLAIVIDEFGGTEGLVTMNDILEAIVGDLSVGGIVHKSIVRREDGSLLLDGRLSVADLRDILNLKQLPLDERETYQTLGGFVLTRMEKVPREADKFVWEDYIFEIVDMDGRRVDKVLVSRKEATERED
jgi:putative hemolysin